MALDVPAGGNSGSHRRRAEMAREQRRVNVDFPVWMIDSLDREAKRLGVSRQAVIKVWIAERLKQQGHTAA
jgi:hypothetical protein